MPFDIDRNKKLLMSGSTGFTRTGDDSVSAEKATDVGREMLDGQPVTLFMREEKKIHLDSLSSTD